MSASGSPADLATIDQVAAYLRAGGQPISSSDDQLIGDMITRESEAISNVTGRDFALTSYSETRNGSGSSRMTMRHFPIVSVASLSIDGITVPAASCVFSDMQISVPGWIFTRGFQNVAITYSAGYATIPEDLAKACVTMVALRYRERDRIGHKSKTIGAETVSYMIDALPKDVALILNQYNRVTT